jgi:L-threonylcarbamoyladenylate synthase
MPTETVYGLAADAIHDEAVACIYTYKNRPQFNPLIVHVASLAMVEAFAHITPQTKGLMQHFWFDEPTPLTFVLPKREGTKLSPLATAGLTTVAVRMPHHPLALALIEMYGSPLVAPSANPSNHLSATRADVVQGYFPGLYVLDGGPCPVGLESTIIQPLEDGRVALLRPGGTAVENLEVFLGEPLLTPAAGPINAPGMLKRHYAPRTPLYRNQTYAEPGEALLGFGPDVPHATLNLSPSSNVVEAAANLFGMLHTLDQGGYTAIRVMPLPTHGLGLAINDRLSRASVKDNNHD